MVLKTFNLEADVYDKFSKLCKSYGMSMSRQVEAFMESFVAEEPIARKEYLEKLERIRRQKSIKIGTIEDFKKRYGIR